MENMDFSRITVCRPKLKLANVSYNVEKIIANIENLAENGTQFICFPELALTGYTCGDLFHQSTLIGEVVNGLKSIEETSIKHPSLVIIVGFPFSYQGSLFNFSPFIFC